MWGMSVLCTPFKVMLLVFNPVVTLCLCVSTYRMTVKREGGPSVNQRFLWVERVMGKLLTCGFCLKNEIYHVVLSPLLLEEVLSQGRKASLSEAAPGQAP